MKGLLADGLRSELPMQLAALGAGGCMTAAAFLLAAWPLGLGEEVKALRTKAGSLLRGAPAPDEGDLG